MSGRTKVHAPGVAFPVQSVVWLARGDGTLITVDADATETALLTASIPANRLQVGSVIVMEAWGVFDGSTSLGAPTTTFRHRLDGLTGTVALASPDLDLGDSSGVWWFWRMESIAEVYTVGASGTCRVQGSLTIPKSTTYPTVIALDDAGAADLRVANDDTETIDTTQPLDFMFTVKYSTAAAGNTLRCTNKYAYLLNP